MVFSEEFGFSCLFVFITVLQSYHLGCCNERPEVPIINTGERNALNTHSSFYQFVTFANFNRTRS